MSVASCGVTWGCRSPPIYSAIAAKPKTPAMTPTAGLLAAAVGTLVGLTTLVVGAAVPVTVGATVPLPWAEGERAAAHAQAGD